MKFSIKEFFSKCDQIHRKLRIWSHLRKKSLMKNFIFCAVCVSISRRAKRSYYGNLDLKDITDNKNIGATVKPLFSNKIKSAEYITFEENGKFVNNDKEVGSIFNGFFLNIVPNLGINKC